MSNESGGFFGSDSALVGMEGREPTLDEQVICCANCKNFGYAGATDDSSYQGFWCAENQRDGIATTDELSDDIAFDVL